MIRRLMSWFGGSDPGPAAQTITAPTSVIAPKARTLTPGPTIAYVNQSTVATDAQIATIVAALQIQVDRDFSPVWKIDANLV